MAIDFTKEQRIRMADKLQGMKNGNKFLLNKQNPVDALMVELTKQGCYKYIYTCDSKVEVAKSTTWYGLVAGIVKALNRWDLVEKQHFINCARTQGLEP